MLGPFLIEPQLETAVPTPEPVLMELDLFEPQQETADPTPEPVLMELDPFEPQQVTSVPTPTLENIIFDVVGVQGPSSGRLHVNRYDSENSYMMVDQSGRRIGRTRSQTSANTTTDSLPTLPSKRVICPHCNKTYGKYYLAKHIEKKH